jgi:hypothetical protein
MKNGRRAGTRHRWGWGNICDWCGRSKEHCMKLDRAPKLTTEQKQRNRAQRNILRKHGFL